MENSYYLAIIMTISMSQNFINLVGPYMTFLISTLFNIKMYRMISEESINYISHNVKNDFCSSYTEQGNPIGLIINKAWIPKYILWVHGSDYDRTVNLFCTEKVKEKLISGKKQSYNVKLLQEDVDGNNKDNKDKNDEKTNEVKYYTRQGNYEYFFYNLRKVEIEKEYTSEQKAIANDIIVKFNKQGYLTCFIYGKTGSGKTMLSYLLAKTIKCSICDTFNPTEPSDSLMNLYSKISPTKDDPLIILLDEVDNINKWSPGGHKQIKDKRISNIENYPTVDIHMKQIGFRKQWEAIIHAYIAPLVSYLYSPFKTTGINIAFVVKYELGKQNHLKPHHDSATYSLVLTLNRPNIDFEGGGTRFVKQNVTTQGKKGYCAIHPGRLTHYHEGIPITKGKRYIMVSFII